MAMIRTYEAGIGDKRIAVSLEVGEAFFENRRVTYEIFKAITEQLRADINANPELNSQGFRIESEL